MNIAGKITDAQFRDIVLASWRLGRTERDLRAADMVREIKRRLLAELQANTQEAATAAEGIGTSARAGSTEGRLETGMRTGVSAQGGHGMKEREAIGKWKADSDGRRSRQPAAGGTAAGRRSE